jgi:hypothetical protein
MSWDDIAPFRPGASRAAQPAVEFTVGHKPGSAHGFMIRVVLRPWLLPPLPDWLEPGQGVRVLRGSGEDAGKLRFTPGGKARVQKVRGAGLCALVVPIPLWAGLRNEVQRAAAEYRLAETSLEIDLPVWAYAPTTNLRRAA